jgi:hypothetical protein
MARVALREVDRSGTGFPGRFMIDGEVVMGLVVGSRSSH